VEVVSKPDLELAPLARTWSNWGLSTLWRAWLQFLKSHLAGRWDFFEALILAPILREIFKPFFGIRRLIGRFK